MDDDHIFFKGHKRGRSAVIPVPTFFVNALRNTRPHSEKIFNVTYFSVYKFVLRHVDSKRLLKTGKNRSVTHLFRKESMKKQLYEYGNTLQILVDYYGWEDKRSSAYYL